MPYVTKSLLPGGSGPRPMWWVSYGHTEAIGSSRAGKYSPREKSTPYKSRVTVKSWWQQRCFLRNLNCGGLFGAIF